jgi:hypothetical protein
MRLAASLAAGIAFVLSGEIGLLLLGDSERCVEGGSDLTTHCKEIRGIYISVNSRVVESECQPARQLKAYSYMRRRGSVFNPLANR